MSERSDWFCSKCGKYNDPQSLDYDTGECWKCQDNIMEETITISRKEYEELQQAFRKLNALERAGVDNWEWYGDAMETLDE